jgi:hypothetical protein
VRAAQLDGRGHHQQNPGQRGDDRLTVADARLVSQLLLSVHRPPIGCGSGWREIRPEQPARARQATIEDMEGSGFGGLFGDPDDLQRRLGEFAEQMQGAQRLAWADNAIKLAVDLTVAAMNRANIQGTTEQQAEQMRSVMAVIFPEAVTLVREAREGLQ